MLRSAQRPHIVNFSPTTATQRKHCCYHLSLPMCVRACVWSPHSPCARGRHRLKACCQRRSGEMHPRERHTEPGGWVGGEAAVLGVQLGGRAPVDSART